MLENFKVIRMWDYRQRVIFLTQIGDKFQLFYRSSGLAGYNSRGQVFPHLLLKATQDRSPNGLGAWMCLGWIPAYYVYNGRYQEYHQKHRKEFPEAMYPYMDELEKMDTSQAFTELNPAVINNFCVDYIKSTEDYVDWYGVSNE